MSDLITAIGKFREWAKAYPPDRLYGEWECDYDSWNAIYGAVFKCVDSRSFVEWSEDELRAVVDANAGDKENWRSAGEIRRRHSELLLPLTRAAVEMGERDNRW